MDFFTHPQSDFLLVNPSFIQPQQLQSSSEERVHQDRNGGSDDFSNLLDDMILYNDQNLHSNEPFDFGEMLTDNVDTSNIVSDQQISLDFVSNLTPAEAMLLSDIPMANSNAVDDQIQPQYDQTIFQQQQIQLPLFDDFYAMGHLQQQLLAAPQYVQIKAERKKPAPEMSNHERLIRIKQRIEGLDFNDVTVLELKSLLRECGVSASGKKHYLVEKLQKEHKLICQKLKLAEIPFMVDGRGKRFMPF